MVALYRRKSPVAEAGEGNRSPNPRLGRRDRCLDINDRQGKQPM